MKDLEYIINSSYLNMRFTNPLKTYQYLPIDSIDEENSLDGKILKIIQIRRIFILLLRLVSWIIGFGLIILAVFPIAHLIEKIQCSNIGPMIGIILALIYIMYALIISEFEFGINNDYHKINEQLTSKLRK